MFQGILMLPGSCGSVFLQKGSRKFWEIKLNHKQTIIYGGQLKKGEPDYKKAIKHPKLHASESDAKQYLYRRIKTKLEREYKIEDKQFDVPTRSVSHVSETSEVDDSDVEEREPYKKVHLEEEKPRKKKNGISQEDVDQLEDKQLAIKRGKLDNSNEEFKIEQKRRTSKKTRSDTDSDFELEEGMDEYLDSAEESERDEESPRDNEEEENFNRKVGALNGPKPLGEPIFRGYNSLCTPNLWKNEDLEGWYLFEKLGGIKVIWNGLEMWSKNGRKYKIPDYISNVLPNSPLEGELCTHMGKLSKCISIVQQPPTREAWLDLRFVVCDAPNLNLPYKERYKKLKEIIPNGPSVFLQDYIVCTGRNHILAELEKIEKSGGEGILLRDPDSLYMKGRVKTVLEVRSSFKGEAIVIGYISGKNKYPGQVGCLKVRSENGTEFAIGRGLTKDMRRNPPEIGSKVIYSYHAKIDETKPRDPLYVKTLSQYSNC